MNKYYFFDGYLIGGSEKFVFLQIRAERAATTLLRTRMIIIKPYITINKLLRNEK